MKKLEKKQIPQFAGLCVLSVGVFGYFVMRLVTPSPAAAGTRPQLVQAARTVPAAHASDTKAAAAQATVTAVDETDVPAPALGMRDPFAVGYVDPKTVTSPTVPTAKPGVPILSSPAKLSPLTASLQGIGPAVPPLPMSLKGFSPQPSAPMVPGLRIAPPAPPVPAAPAWTVTGVLQNPTQKVAILRDGEARRIVRTGEMVDSVYRVVKVTRASVVLRHGSSQFTLPVGGAKTAPPAMKPADTLKPALQPGGAAKDAAKTPARRPADLIASALSHMHTGHDFNVAEKLLSRYL